jgi:hypothetical protein
MKSQARVFRNILYSLISRIIYFFMDVMPVDQGIAYQVLAYKMTRIVRLAGGQIDADGNITELGKITTSMLEIGKQGYLMALQNAGAV